MADIDYDRLSEALADALSRTSDKQEAAIEAKKIADATKAIEKLSKNLKDTSSAGKIFEKVILGQSVAYNNLQKDIENLQDQIQDTTNAEHQRALINRRDELTRAQQYQNLNAAVGNAALGFAKLSVQLGGTFASASGQFVRGLQDGQSSIQLSSTLATGIVDASNQTAQAAAAGIQGLGQVASTSTKPALKGLGVAAQVAGMALSFVSDKASRLAKFGIEVLSKELEKTVNAYQRTSAAGALFADGMQGMRNAAGGAGLTVDQFSNVVSRNAETLAASGLGVGEAAKQMGKVGKVMKEQGIDNKLLRLGYSFEEQAGLSAEVMSDLRRANSAALLDPNQIAKATQDYAVNLRTIAAITGEDAKKKMDESRRMTAQMAVRIKMQEMETRQPGIMREFQASLATMSPEMQTAVNQLMTIGAVTDQTAATMMATNDNFRKAVEGTVSQVNSGSFSAAENQKFIAQQADLFRSNLNSSGTELSIGIAGMAGKLPELNKGFSNFILMSDKMSEEGVVAARAAAIAQMNTSDKLTSNMIDAAKAAQDLALQLQKALDPLIEGYSTVTAHMLKEITKTFKEISDEIQKNKTGADGKPTESLLDKAKRVGGKAVEGALTGATVGGLALGGAASVPLPVIGTVAGSVVGAVGGGLVGGLISGVKEWFSEKEGKSRGGIARGSSSGYLEKLHGSEAVIPLPDGKTVPVSIQTPVTAAMAPEEPKEPPVTTPSMPQEPTPVFATQRLELTGIENIENMARSFVERPTGRLDAGFNQFLSDIRNTLAEANNVVQVKQTAMPESTEVPTALALKETIEKTNAVLSDLMREHTSIMRESLARVTDLVSVTSDTKNINQQLLNNSY